MFWICLCCSSRQLADRPCQLCHCAHNHCCDYPTPVTPCVFTVWLREFSCSLRWCWCAGLTRPLCGLCGMALVGLGGGCDFDACFWWWELVTSDVPYTKLYLRFGSFQLHLGQTGASSCSNSQYVQLATACARLKCNSIIICAQRTNNCSACIASLGKQQHAKIWGATQAEPASYTHCCVACLLPASSCAKVLAAPAVTSFDRRTLLDVAFM